MGLIINVLRHADGMDATNNGISSMCMQLVVVNIDGPFDVPESGMAPVWLESHQPGCLRLRPAVYDNGAYRPVRFWTAMGGNFGYTSDSRFADACEKLLGHRFYGAVAIHDRVE